MTFAQEFARVPPIELDLLDAPIPPETNSKRLDPIVPQDA